MLEKRAENEHPRLLTGSFDMWGTFDLASNMMPPIYAYRGRCWWPQFLPAVKPALRKAKEERRGFKMQINDVLFPIGSAVGKMDQAWAPLLLSNILEF